MAMFNLGLLSNLVANHCRIKNEIGPVIVWEFIKIKMTGSSSNFLCFEADGQDLWEGHKIWKIYHLVLILPSRAVATGSSGVNSALSQFTSSEKLCLVTSKLRQKHYKCIQFTALVGPHYSLFSGKIPLIFMCQNSLQN